MFYGFIRMDISEYFLWHFGINSPFLDVSGRFQNHKIFNKGSHSTEFGLGRPRLGLDSTDR